MCVCIYFFCREFLLEFGPVHLASANIVDHQEESMIMIYPNAIFATKHVCLNIYSTEVGILSLANFSCYCYCCYNL